jgi:hypothetical protein
LKQTKSRGKNEENCQSKIGPCNEIEFEEITYSNIKFVNIENKHFINNKSFGFIDNKCIILELQNEMYSLPQINGTIEELRHSTLLPLRILTPYM